MTTSAKTAYSPSTLNIVTASFMVVFHILAVTALFFFSWTNLLVALVLYWMAVGLGISMGYHRLHTHRGFKTSKGFEYFLAICGTLTLEGGPIFWVATHRLHHQHSDQRRRSAHAARHGGFWAHMGWILFGETHHNDTDAHVALRARPRRRTRFYRWLTTYHWVPLTVLGFALLAIGGWALVNWAIFLRVVVGLHATWLVNSATHMWGTPPLRDAATTRATPGGSRSSRSARAGTTTTTPTRPRRATAWPGTSSTSPGSRSRCSAPSARGDVQVAKLPALASGRRSRVAARCSEAEC